MCTSYNAPCKRRNFYTVACSASDSSTLYLLGSPMKIQQVGFLAYPGWPKRDGTIQARKVLNTTVWVPWLWALSMQNIMDGWSKKLSVCALWLFEVGGQSFWLHHVVSTKAHLHNFAWGPSLAAPEMWVVHAINDGKESKDDAFVLLRRHFKLNFWIICPDIMIFYGRNNDSVVFVSFQIYKNFLICFLNRIRNPVESIFHSYLKFQTFAHP